MLTFFMCIVCLIVLPHCAVGDLYVTLGLTPLNLRAVPYLFSSQSHLTTGQTCTTAYSVQLYSGSATSRNFGQVHICQCSSQGGECVWETVTATGTDREFWSWKNSQVVCRQLGYLGVQNPILSTRLATYTCI